MNNKDMFQMIGLLKPRFGKDGNAWFFLLGTDIQDGVCGFGDTPYQAAKEFCDNFMFEKIKLPPESKEYT